MFYLKGDKLYTKSAAISEILSEMGSVVQPNYIDDETLCLYGFLPAETPEKNTKFSPTREQRERVLSGFDWVSTATNISEKDKESVESWKWIVRNLPDICDSSEIPQPPKIKPIKQYTEKKRLSKKQITEIKNYKCSEESWNDFLICWANLGYPDNRQVLENILTAYAKKSLDEIIGSI